MGMGEPLLNYEEVLESARILNDSNTFSIGARKITISTAGIIPGIRKLANEPEQFKLAVSLNSAIQEKREKLMPIAKKYPLNELREGSTRVL
jgi:23S rRNA (adenine2503-C2)-methyltransferase